MFSSAFTALTSLAFLTLLALEGAVAPFPENHPLHFTNPLIDPWWHQISKESQKKIYSFYKPHIEPAALLLAEAVEAKKQAAQAVKNYVNTKKDLVKALVKDKLKKSGGGVEEGHDHQFADADVQFVEDGEAGVVQYDPTGGVIGVHSHGGQGHLEGLGHGHREGHGLGHREGHANGLSSDDRLSSFKFQLDKARAELTNAFNWKKAAKLAAKLEKKRLLKSKDFWEDKKEFKKFLIQKKKEIKINHKINHKINKINHKINHKNKHKNKEQTTQVWK